MTRELITKKISVKTFGNDKPLKGNAWVGIDQSYSGFAITVLDENDNWKTWVYKAEGSGIQRLWDIRAFMYDVFYQSFDYYSVKVRDIAMEGYAFGSQMAHMLGELGGMVKMYCFEEFGFNALLVPPTSLKKYVTGKGTGVQKNQMLLHIYKKWGIEFTDDNAADSYALARIAAQRGTLAYEKEILEKLDDEKFRA